uniref:Uncharacterized protein n=1 Tax=Ditylenchus dipsaci TaxID=166011 RepID=A0A915EM90_9BILA
MKDKKADQVGLHFANNTRYLVLVISTVALTMSISNSLALNFTIICMKSEQPSDFDPIFVQNETALLQKPKDNSIFSLAESSALFSSTAVGSFLGTLPITYLTANYGLRKYYLVTA